MWVNMMWVQVVTRADGVTVEILPDGTKTISLLKAGSVQPHTEADVAAQALPPQQQQQQSELVVADAPPANSVVGVSSVQPQTTAALAVQAMQPASLAPTSSTSFSSSPKVCMCFVLR
jgi:hypothetical protein